MKRFTAILLLLFLLMSAIQPVFAMHFCGDRLHSFSLFQSNKKPSNCCGEKIKPEKSDPLQVVFPKDHNVAIHFLNKTHTSCCDTQLVKPSTDDYQTKIGQAVSRIASISYEGAAAMFLTLFNLSESETTTLTFFQDYPPKGFFLLDVSLLTYICTYRI